MSKPNNRVKSTALTEDRPLAEALAESEDLALSETHRLLSNERRRTTMAELLRRSTPVDSELVAWDVTTREAERTPESPSAETVRRVHTLLHHVHLPKLDAAGLIEYDADSGAVEDVYLDL